MVRFVYTDKNGKILEIEDRELSRSSLSQLGAMATLQAILNPDFAEAFANAAGYTLEDLIHEAQSWAVAQELNNGN